MSNPILNNDRFTAEENIVIGEPMTIQGTISKIFMLFACLIAGAAISLYFLFTNPQYATLTMLGGSIIGFILVIATCFNVSIAKFTAAPYAFCEGLLLGGFSAFFESAYKGIVLQAILATFMVLFVMLMLYKAKIITYTEKFRAVLLTGILSIGGIYLIQIVAMLFGRSIPAIFDNGPIGLLFSFIVIVFAALSLIQDFNFIEESSARMLPKDYEWFGAMGLMITLIWLYMEILRLFAKLNSRR